MSMRDCCQRLRRRCTRSYPMFGLLLVVDSGLKSELPLMRELTGVAAAFVSPFRGTQESGPRRPACKPPRRPAPASPRVMPPSAG
jgi:hypothetical protein